MHVNMDLCIHSLVGQMSGLCGGEGYRFKTTAAVERCSLRVTGRLQLLLTQECIKTDLISCLSSKSFCFTGEEALKKVVILKGFECLEEVICERWILFDFHYLNSLPLERRPFPSINN